MRSEIKAHIVYLIIQLNNFTVSTHSMYTHENNVPSCLSPQWLCGNSCTWAHEVRLHIVGTYEPKMTTLYIRVFQIVLRGVGGIPALEAANQRIRNTKNVYKEYEIKTKMVQEQWLQLKLKFSLGYNMKIIN